MLVCTLRGDGEGSEELYCLYTHENVDIFGWPLNDLSYYTVSYCRTLDSL